MATPTSLSSAGSTRPLGGQNHGPLVDKLRRLVDAVAAGDAPDEVVAAVMSHLDSSVRLLGPYASVNGPFPSGGRRELPGRGHPALMPLVIDSVTENHMKGRITFSRGLIGHGAVHGGMLPLLFDEALGVFPTRLDPPARTAYLHVDYRNLTPAERELDVSAELLSIVGRKVEVRGELRADGLLLAEARALFVQPRTGVLAGQPTPTPSAVSRLR